MHAFISESKLDFRAVKHQVTLHLSKMLERFESYFPELTEEQAASYQRISK